MSIYYQNVRGLRTKSKQFLCSSSSFDYKIIVLTETWLTNSHHSSEFFDSSFSVHRKDRHDTSNERGGGVLIAVHNNYNSESIQLDCDSSIEYVCVKISINDKYNLFLYAAYISPCSNAAVYAHHREAINKIPSKPVDTTIILGDFNIPQANWILDGDDSNVMVPTSISPVYAADFIEEIQSKGFLQVNSIVNSHNKLLDLIFTDDHSNCEIFSPKPLTKIDDYHPPLMIQIEWHLKQSEKNQQKSHFNFNKTDYIKLNNYLALQNFEELFANKDIDEKVDIFYDILLTGIKNSTPLHINKSNSKCPWKNRELQQLKNKKNKEWKKCVGKSDKSSFESAFNAFNEMNTQLYNQYVDKMKSSLKDEPSQFWNYVKSLKNTDSNPVKMSLGAKSSTNQAEQVEMFASFFSKNFITPASTTTTTTHTASHTNTAVVTLSPSSNEFGIDKYFIFDELTNIDTKKGVGPDDIHPSILKNCSALLYEPLSLIFNESQSLGYFPNKWKSSSVKPIFKKGARSNVENYRPIAKLPTIAKFFELLVNKKLTMLIEKFIVHQQHGFRRKKSTVTNLSEFVTYALKGINAGSQIDVLYTDFAKAFDRVNHKILIAKLHDYNIPKNLIAWIQSYLSNRRQFVRYRESDSVDYIVNSGVPQGSHIGPTLFLLFINDLATQLGDDVFVSLFADDVKIAKAINSQSDAATLQAAINKLKQWCDTNELHLNLGKCEVLTLSHKRNKIITDYNFGNHIFERVDHHKDLGVLIDHKLKFNAHIETIISRATAALGFLKRFCYDIRDLQTLKVLFYTLVQSQLEYCSVVWLPYYGIYKNKIESILRQFTMYAMREYPNQSNGYHITPYKDRLSLLGMQSLDRRRFNSSIMFMHDMLFNIIHCPSLRSEISFNNNTRNLRHTDLIKIRDSHFESNPTLSLYQMCKYSNLVKDLFLKPFNRNIFKSKLSQLDDDIFFR